MQEKFQKFLKSSQKGLGILGRSGTAEALNISVASRGNEEQHDEGGHNNTNDFEALEPLLVIPTNGLEHAPETVLQVEEQGDEPYDITGQNPRIAEGGNEEIIRILCLCTHEFLQLHLGPEVGEVETEQTQDDDAQDGHVLGAPAVVLGFGGNLIALETTTLLYILVAEPDTI